MKIASASQYQILSLQAFPLLNEATYVREFASFITLYPDAVYYLFQTTAGQSLILVAIDYPDPMDESQQVKKMSGGLSLNSHILSNRMLMTNTLESAQMMK